MKIIKSMLFILLVVALSVGATAIISRNTGSFTTTPTFTNENNLVHTIDEYESSAGTFANGMTWKINSTGSIVANGTYSDANVEDLVFNLGTITIETEDYYTLSGAPKGSLESFYIEAKYQDASGNIKTLMSDFSDTMTSVAKLPVGTQVTLRIIVKPGVTFSHYTFKPTLVAGTEAGSF